jgi:hypothetical protein
MLCGTRHKGGVVTFVDKIIVKNPKEITSEKAWIIMPVWEAREKGLIEEGCIGYDGRVAELADLCAYLNAQEENKKE